MAFFARPDLSNEQFKQLSGSTLTLSGETQISNVSGLSINDGSGNYIPIVVTGGTNNDVLTYINGKILLTETSGGTGVYVGTSPTTCTVGGLQSGTNIACCSISCILQDILVPTLYPTFTLPSSSFTISPSTLLYEVGTSISITGDTSFNRGCIDPAYSTSGYRSGTANSYEYNIWGSTCCYSDTSSSRIQAFGSHSVAYGNNTISSKVHYNVGEQPKDSEGCNYCSPLASGCTDTDTYTISGIYPYFYGTCASGGVAAGCNRPTANAAMIIGGSKVVGVSTNTICINFNSTADDYIWFAIPVASACKTCWYINALNNGAIGGGVSAGCNLFPDPTTVSNIATTCWNGQQYKVYISNYQTAAASIIQLRNS
jgi:hypothetical protein